MNEKEKIVIRDVVTEMVERNSSNLKNSGSRIILQRSANCDSISSHESSDVYNDGCFNNKTKVDYPQSFPSFQSSSPPSCHRVIHTQVEIHPVPSRSVRHLTKSSNDDLSTVYSVPKYMTRHSQTTIESQTLPDVVKVSTNGSSVQSQPKVEDGSVTKWPNGISSISKTDTSNQVENTTEPEAISLPCLKKSPKILHSKTLSVPLIINTEFVDEDESLPFNQTTMDKSHDSEEYSVSEGSVRSSSLHPSKFVTSSQLMRARELRRNPTRCDSRSPSPISMCSLKSADDSVNMSMVSDISSILGAEREQVLNEKMRNIVGHFRTRAKKVRSRLEAPPSPDDADFLSDDGNEGLQDGMAGQEGLNGVGKRALYHQQQQFGNAHFRGRNFGALERIVFDDYNSSLYASKSTIIFEDWHAYFDFNTVRRKLEFIDPRGYVNIAWLSIQAIIFLYNAWVIPLRAIFPFAKTSHHPYLWLLCDYLGDLIYWLDVLVYKPRLMFIENGFWVKNKKRLSRHYVREGTFKYDLLALTPTDLLYLWFGTDATYLRLPRIVKVLAYWEFTDRLDAILEKPYFLRIVKTVNYMLYLIHINACAYYAMSKFEGIGSNLFVYDGEGNSYIRSFYFATKTATSIGKNKKPTNIPETLFMTASWLMGVFVFAILIGDIRDIVSNARVNVLTYQKHLDAVTAYMNNNKVARRVQDRVKRWMYYTWSTQKTFDENKILEFLPLKMRTDIAMRVHFSTLGKVKLFRNCEPGLLKDLVVLLRPVIYLPGDYVCRKGDIGKEMFILQSGQVQVLGGMDGRKVVVTLGQGSVFGEIALLGVGGMNRRTADVVSRGFTNLFVLQKDDLEEVLKDYPDAKRILNARARKLMKENEDRLVREMSEQQKQRRKMDKNLHTKDFLATSSDLNLLLQGTSPSKRDPALIETVLKMLPPHSRVYEYLRKHQETKGKKELGSISKQDLETDAIETDPFSVKRPASSLSMTELSQQVIFSGSRSLQDTPARLSREPDVYIVNKNCFDLFSPTPNTPSSTISSKGEAFGPTTRNIPRNPGTSLSSQKRSSDSLVVSEMASSVATSGTRRRRQMLKRQEKIDASNLDNDETTML